MKKSYRSIEPKGIEDYLRELCVIYRGEMDNPHDVNSIIDEERRIQILRYTCGTPREAFSRLPDPGGICTSRKKEACR